jgi:oligopeptide transport system substrate-binding protein
MTRPKARFIQLFIMALALGMTVHSAWPSTVRRGLGPEPDSLDIHQAQGLAAVNLLRDLREGLVTFDVQGEPVPGAASGWEVLEGGSLYRFTLRPGLRWSNGDPLTASDFVRAWQRAFSPGTGAAMAGLLMDVSNAAEVLHGKMEPAALGITALAPDVLEIRLSEPAPWVVEILAHPVSYPMHESVNDDVRTAPVNGAYLLGEWTPRAMIRLKKNPEFHASSTVLVDTVEYLPIEEPAAELSRYRAGELDITETIPAGRYDWLKRNLNADLRVNSYLGSFWLGLNLNHSALGHSSTLRRALALAIDRSVLTAVVLGAGELPGWSIVPPGLAGYQPAHMEMSDASQQERDAEAQRLFGLSGFASGDPLLLELRYNTSGLHRRVAVAVSAMWKQALGVNTELINEEWKVFVNNRRLGVITEVFRGGWIADYADPGSFLDLFVGGSAMNTTFYSNPEFDPLRLAADRAHYDHRLELLHQAETLLMRDMPAIPLYYYVSRHLVNPRIAGFVDNVRDIHLSRYLELKSENH